MWLAWVRRLSAEGWERNRQWLAQLVLAVGTHRPGQKPRQVRRRFAPIVGTGLQKRLEPVARIQPPQQDGLQHAKQHRGQLGAPDTPRAVVILATDHGIPQRAVTVDERIAPSTSASKPRMPVSRHEAPQLGGSCQKHHALWLTTEYSLGYGLLALQGSHGLSFIPPRKLGVHDLCTLLHSCPFHPTAHTSAYPRRYPWPWLLAGSCPIRLAVGTCSELTTQPREHVWGYFVPDSRLTMNGGWQTLPGSLWGECPTRGNMSAQNPVPFGSSVAACFAGST